MPGFERDGLVLTYDDSGETDRTPLVFLHGLSQARTTWARITPAFAATYRIVALDQRGHGESSHAPGTYTLASYGPDAVAFCEEVVGATAVLVGHSLGGVVAAYVARERPDLVLGAFLEDPPLYRGAEASSGRAGESAVARMFPVLHSLLTEMRGRQAPFEEYLAMISAAPALNGSGTFADVLGRDGARAMARSMAGLDPEVFPPAIDGSAISPARTDVPVTTPVVILRADPALGPAFTADDAARFLEVNPHAVITEVEGASHAIHDEQPERFVEELRTFLGVTAAASR